MSKLIKVGQMPGTIQEVAVEETATFAEVLELAGLSTSGYEIKADSRTITDANEQVGNTSLVLLTKQVKGNGLVKIGQMPGTINEYALEDGATFAQALELAGLNSSGYEVKADSRTVTNLSESADGTALILLTKQVKGNALLKVGQMPGTINEYAVEPGTSFADVLSLAGLDASGYEVKADSRTITDLNQSADGTSLVLLTKQVKGNK